MSRWLLALARILIVSLVALPVLYAALASLVPVVSVAAWAELLATPGVVQAWVMSAWVAGTATVTAAAIAWHLAARAMQPTLRRRSAGDEAEALRAQAWLGPMLAVPHAAFAVGVMVLLAPAGLIARLLGTLLGWTEPPASGWMVDSPLALVVVLVLKELPFLLWNVLSTLRRPDVLLTLRAADRQAALLGHGPTRRWWLVHAPMHAASFGWPLLAVLAYGLAVVDVPLVTGPTLPPPLAVLAWEAVVDPDPARQAAGAAMAWMLVASLAALAIAFVWAARGAARVSLRWAARGPAGGCRGLSAPGSSSWRALMAAYVAVVAALSMASFTGPWPFPGWLPPSWTTEAWRQVVSAAPRAVYSFVVAAIVATTATGLAVAWLATTPARWDRRSLAVAMATVLLPPLLLSIGLYEAALRVRLDATHLGLAWAHLLFACTYALLMLAGPWRGLDRRYLDTSRLLGHGAWATLLRVQVPLMRGPLAAAWAVAFAVSIAQYLPTQLIGAGRITTLATEAVTRAASGQRSVAAATALLLALLPCLVFVLAARSLADPTRPAR